MEISISTPGGAIQLAEIQDPEFPGVAIRVADQEIAAVEYQAATQSFGVHVWDSAEERVAAVTLTRQWVVTIFRSQDPAQEIRFSSLKDAESYAQKHWAAAVAQGVHPKGALSTFTVGGERPWSLVIEAQLIAESAPERPPVRAAGSGKTVALYFYDDQHTAAFDLARVLTQYAADFPTGPQIYFYVHATDTGLGVIVADHDPSPAEVAAAWRRQSERWWDPEVDGNDATRLAWTQGWTRLVPEAGELA